MSMANKNNPAFPTEYEDERGKRHINVGTMGLTKREYFAIHILQGYAANSMGIENGVEPPYRMGSERRVKYAIEEADELLKQLAE